MIVLTSMSDIRTKLLLGTSIGALAMIFVMAAGVDAFDTKTSTASQSGVLNGHVTVMAIHPDGTTSYSQADNAIVVTGLDAAAAQLFGAAQSDAFECINIGEGNIAGNAADIDVPLGVTGLTCDVDGILDLAGNGVVEIDAVFTIVDNDVTPNITGTATLTEATLENNAGVVLSKVNLAAAVNTVSGTVVTITYTMTLT